MRASYLPWVLAAAATAGAPAATAVKLTPETMNDGVSIGDPSYSPDGRVILFTSDKSGRQKIWTMSAEGGDHRLLIGDEGGEAAPVWSPDGRRIAFTRTTAGQSDIWVVSADGSGLKRVTSDREDERAPGWSPDGTRLLFMSSRSGAADVWTVSVAGGAPAQLTEKTNAPDETRFAASWSPDGRTIAYVSNRSDYFADDLWVVDVQSKVSRRLSVDVHVMASPSWSPDGKYLAFHGVPRSGFWHSDTSDIYLADMPAGTIRRLPMNTFASDANGGSRLVWSANSKFLYFSYEWQGDINLWTVPVTGGVATQMTYLDGTFRRFSISPDGRSVAFVRSTQMMPAELFRMPLEGGAPQQLTDWGIKYENLRAPQKIAYRSTDGYYMLGYLYLPPDFDASRKYPALVQAHGGGTNANGNGWHVLEHLMSQNGFIVLAIEYRGGSGHGREFQLLALGEYGAGQGWDAVGAARYLATLPYCNGKIGMYGGSYGARMTMAAVTRDSTPFTAVAPLYGSYDWEEAYPFGDRLEQKFTVELHMGFKPGEHAELYAHTAAKRQLDTVKRDLPFFLIHGERDRRTPFMQFGKLIDELKQRGNPVEYHSYPEEAHGIRLAKNRTHAYSRMIEFFKKHLVAP
jgi:dipeptidyl aminopeptidase/acylaminoacyl peptidase